jgi:hypothetical protein
MAARGARAGRGRRAAGFARRLYPLAVAAWERWQSLSPEQKERYRRMATDYTRRGREALSARQQQRRRR